MKKIILLFLSMFLIQNIVCADYSFKIDNRNITYNEDELKFYENGKVLSKEEVQNLFPEYEIVLISNFSLDRKYRIKKTVFKSKKILVLNDTKRTFHLFNVYPNSSRDEFLNFKNGEIKSLITIYGKKNVRIKHFGGDEFELVVK